MSHNRDDSLYDDGSYFSEGFEREEPYVPDVAPNPTHMVGGRTPVQISNSDLMDKLYHMGNNLKEFDTRLKTIRSKRSRNFPYRRGDRQVGNELVGGFGAPTSGVGRGVGQFIGRGFPMVTPRRLEFGENEPIVDYPEDSQQNQDLSKSPRPPSNQSGCADFVGRSGGRAVGVGKRFTFLMEV